MPRGKHRTNPWSTAFFAGAIILFAVGVVTSNPIILRLVGSFTVQPRGGSYLIVTRDGWVDDCAGFASWKAGQGYTPSVVGMSDVYAAYPTASVPSDVVLATEVRDVRDTIHCNCMVFFWMDGYTTHVFGFVGADGEFYQKASAPAAQPICIFNTEPAYRDISFTMDYWDGSSLHTVSVGPLPYQTWGGWYRVVITQTGGVTYVADEAWSVAQYIHAHQPDFVLLVGNTVTVPAFPLRRFGMNPSGDYLRIDQGATDDPYTFSTLPPSTMIVGNRHIAVGTHTFSFTFDDGHGHTVRAPETGSVNQPTVSDTPPANQPPTLSNGYVTPTSGTASTSFTYAVTYTDVDGDTPAARSVLVDGYAHTMTLVSGTPSSGATYRFTTTLGEGSHTYAFRFDDGHGHTVLLPASGTYAGPTVTEESPPEYGTLRVEVTLDGAALSNHPVTVSDGVDTFYWTTDSGGVASQTVLVGSWTAQTSYGSYPASDAGTVQAGQTTTLTLAVSTAESPPDDAWLMWVLPMMVGFFVVVGIAIRVAW